MCRPINVNSAKSMLNQIRSQCIHFPIYIYIYITVFQVMKRNIDRVRKIAESGVEAGKFLESCFDWESKPRSVTAFAVS